MHKDSSQEGFLKQIDDDFLKNLDEVELDFSKEKIFDTKIIKIELDNELEQALGELENLKAQLPKNKREDLLEQCKENALNAINSQFGLGSAVLTNQDGGNVHTTHNVRQGTYAKTYGLDPKNAISEEAVIYENNKKGYNSRQFHQDSKYIETNRQQSELKKQGKLKDYMTGKKINPNDKTDLDHIVSAKEIYDDPARFLAEKDARELANTETNLKMTDASLNRSKQDKSAQEFIENRDKRLSELQRIKEKRGHLNDNELKEQARLIKQLEIKDEEFIQKFNQEKKRQGKEVDKAHYTSFKPYGEMFKTGALDAGKTAIHTALGMVLKDFFTALIDELKTTLKNFGNESLKEIFTRFKDRAKIVFERVKQNFKDIFAGSIEQAIMSFLSNLLTFVINIFVTTLKSFVRIVRAGFVSLCKAVKFLANPPKDMPKEDVYFEASKIFVTGIISALTMLGAEVIAKWLYTIPVLGGLMAMPIPFTNETIADALSLSLGACGGAILSTIAIYYMDKFYSKRKEDKIQVQIMTKSGEIVQYRLAQTTLTLIDSYVTVTESWTETIDKIHQSENDIKESSREVKGKLAELDELSKELKQISRSSNV